MEQLIEAIGLLKGSADQFYRRKTKLQSPKIKNARPLPINMRISWLQLSLLLPTSLASHSTLQHKSVWLTRNRRTQWQISVSNLLVVVAVRDLSLVGLGELVVWWLAPVDIINPVRLVVIAGTHNSIHVTTPTTRTIVTCGNIDHSDKHHLLINSHSDVSWCPINCCIIIIIKQTKGMSSRYTQPWVMLAEVFRLLFNIYVTNITQFYKFT